MRRLPIVIGLMSFPTMGISEIAIHGPERFISRVQSTLDEGRRLSPHTRQLIEQLERAPQRLEIRPITSNPNTWHRDGERSRSHTRSLDRDADYDNKRSPVNALIYLNEKRVSRSHRTYKRGILIHELVHALDLMTNRYHKDAAVREKRAVFFQNIWRDAHAIDLRTHYHGQFNTLEYQWAKRTGQVDAFIDYLLHYNDIPVAVDDGESMSIR